MAQITQGELDQLLDAKAKLSALVNAGVDNWEGYSFALDEYNEYQEKLKKADSVTDEVIETLANAVFEPSERGAGFAFTDDAIERVYSIIRKALA
jgi:hypothetical protein